MSTLTAPPDGDRDRATELNAFAWTWFGLSTTFVAARLYSRIRITRNFWYDDYFIVLTWALTLAFSILWTVLGHIGGCRHLYYLEMDPAQAIRASRINWITQPVAIYALATGKVSVAFLILRIMGKSRWRRAFLIYGAMIASFIFCTIAVILTFAQCRPVTALWNPELVLMEKATCWPPQRQSDFSLFVGSWLAFIDLALALLPITIMWNLRISTKRKIGICAVLGLGIFACICACIKTSKLPELNARADITFITVTLWIWNANECNVVIIAACIPTLRPLFLIVFKRPGRDQYLQRKTKSPNSSSRNRPNRIGQVSAPISDSTTAIGHAEHDDNWIELNSAQHSTHKDGEIEQTLEFDVTSHKKTGVHEEEAMFSMTRGSAV